jgi:hypothetical protein
MQRKGHRWFATAILGIAFVAQAQSNIATGSLSERIRQLAGPNAKDCGQAGSLTVAGEGLAEPCLVSAFQSHQAAFWIQNEASRLAPTAAAVVVMPSGTVYRITRERSDSSLSENSCVQPFVATEYGRQRLRCKESYSPPYRAGDLALRVGGPDVVAPRPVAPLHLDPAVCGSGKPGEGAQVEFVISEEGKVLLADVFAVPKPCDLPALVAGLRKVQFTPGTLRGTPMLTSWFTIVLGGP